MTLMSDELNAAAPAEAEEEIKAEAEEPEVEETKEASQIDNKIDYESELKREKEAREKAERALAAKRYKESANKRQGEYETEQIVEEDDDAESKPLTKRDLAELLAKERQATQREFYTSRISELINRYTSNDSEKALISDIMNNRTWPAYIPLEEQVEEAYAIANRKRLLGENAELKRALANKRNVDTAGVGTYQEPKTAGEPKLTPEDRGTIAEARLTYNTATRRYEKKIGNKLIYFDIKTKRIIQL